MGTPLNFQLSNEQQIFIEKALQGEWGSEVFSSGIC